MQRNLSPEEFLKDPSRYLMVDVRSQEEWDACHEEGAAHIPLIELEERSEELPKDKPLLLVCRTGGRSDRACQILGALGFEALNLLGGLRMLVRARMERGQIAPKEAARMLERLG